MAISQESITKLKTDYEAKIAKLSKPAQTAAKSAWNKLIQAAAVVLAAELTKLKSLKLLDKVSLATAVGALGKLQGAASAYKAKVQAPMKKVLSSSKSGETAELTKTLDGMGKSNDAAADLAKNKSGRIESSSAKVDQKIKELELNINSLNKLKF